MSATVDLKASKFLLTARSLAPSSLSYRRDKFASADASIKRSLTLDRLLRPLTQPPTRPDGKSQKTLSKLRILRDGLLASVDSTLMLALLGADP